MQPVLERGSIDKTLTFDVGLIQLSFIPVCSPNTCKGVFNPNVPLFQSNCTEGLTLLLFLVNVDILQIYTYIKMAIYTLDNVA